MSFMNPPPENYDGRRRVLLSADDLEIENPWKTHYSVSTALLKKMSKASPVGENFSSSYYLDTDQLSLLLSTALTVRARKGNEETSYLPDGTKQKGETFDKFELAVKGLNAKWQSLSNELLSRALPDLQLRSVFPIIRVESEGPIKEPKGIVRFGINDLPQKPWRGQPISIANEISRLINRGEIIGISDPNELSLRPWVLTEVLRQRVKVVIDPYKVYDFTKEWPGSKPTAEMIGTQKFLTLELAIDKMRMYACPTDMSISDMTSIPRRDLLPKLIFIGKRSLTEYEIKSKEAGKKITDLEALTSYSRFGKSLLDFANKVTLGSWGMLPTYSKGIIAFGEHPLCREDRGPLFVPYTRALAYAA